MDAGIAAIAKNAIDRDSSIILSYQQGILPVMPEMPAPLKKILRSKVHLFSGVFYSLTKSDLLKIILPKYDNLIYFKSSTPLLSFCHPSRLL